MIKKNGKKRLCLLLTLSIILITTTAPASTTPVQPKTSAPKTISTTGIKINESIGTMEKGSTQKLTATITPSNATNKNVSWKSSNNEIATVNSSGEVTAVKTGTVDIIAVSSNGLENSISIAVTQPPTEIKINENIKELEIDESKVLTAIVNPSDAFDKTVEWQSSDNEILTIDKEGKITAKKAGKAIIAVTSVNGLNDSIEIIVKEPKQIENTKQSSEGTTTTDMISGLLGLGTLGGGYWLYKNNKNNK